MMTQRPRVPFAECFPDSATDHIASVTQIGIRTMNAPQVLNFLQNAGWK
jgi:hypothetical protein